MKKVLLGVAGVGAEMGLTETAQAGEVGAAPGEIKAPQRAGDPDIDGKGLLKTVREEQNTVGDFDAHAMQFQQGGARFFEGQGGEAGEVEFAGGQFRGGAGQVGGAKAQLAFAQFQRRHGRQTRCGGKRPRRPDAFGRRKRVAVTAAEQGDDLLDLHDLLGG